MLAANFDASIAADGMGYPPNIVQSSQGASQQIIWNTSAGFGGVTRDIIANISGQTPGGFSFARYQAGAFDFLISPRDPVAALQNLGPYTNPLRERYSGGDTSVPASQAWAPSPNYGFVYTTVRKNGQQWNDTSPYFYAATYVALDPVASANAYDMIGGHFRGAQFYTRTTKIVTGTPLDATSQGPSSGALQRCAVPISVAWFPYPPQRRDISYGLPLAAVRSSGDFQAAPQSHRFFPHPTPGGPNGEGLLGLVGPVQFSRASGFVDSAFKLNLAANPRGATVYYTTDGSTPSATNGTRFTRAIPITTTTVVRAVALRAQFAPSDLECRTYIFISDVEKQTGEEFPVSWGSRSNSVIPAHYAMSAEIVNDPDYQQRLRKGLLSLPSVSIVTDLPNLFDPVTGIYTHPMTNGLAWERPASAEMIEPNRGTGFRINCGLRIQGGWNRRPEESPKHSFRLLFKKDYGPSKLRFPLFGTDGVVEFDTVILRGGNNNSWLHWNSEERRRAEYARDQWMRESFLAMGYPSARGRFVHLYLNGLYWGVYNLCERPSASFLAANQGGSPKDFDSRKAEKVLSGDKTVWHRLMALANSGLRDDEKYRQFQECVDLTELTDYLILNFYGGNADWDRSSNWYAGRRRTADGKYQFFVWDGERTLEGIDVNSMDFDDDESPPRLFHKLSENADYRMFFADRVQKLLFNSGPLTAEPAAKRYKALAEILENPLVAESARWGSYRRDIHSYKVGPYEFYKPDVHWRPEVNRLLSQYFAQRPAAIIQLFRERGLFPRVDAPTGQIQDGLLRLSSRAGTIYYTLTGADPRTPGGAVAPYAMRYSRPVALNPGQKLKARSAAGSQAAREWSTLVEF